MLTGSYQLIALGSPPLAEASEAGCEGIDPRLIHCPAPIAPRALGLSDGKVVVRLGVRPDGTVGEAKIISSSGHRAWDRSVVLAVTSWRFGASSDGFTKDLTLLLTVDGGKPPN